MNVLRLNLEEVPQRISDVIRNRDFITEDILWRTLKETRNHYRDSI